MKGLGGRRYRVNADVVLWTTSATKWAVAVLEVVPKPPKLILEPSLSKEEGPVISACSSCGHDRIDLN